MTNKSIDTQPYADAKKKMRVQVAGLVVAIITLTATWYLSVRAERTKALTVEYFAPRQLLAEPNAGPSLQVLHGGQALVAPWLLSVRLANTGNLPIEPRDIERPVRLAFPNARIIASTVSAMRQAAMTVAVEHDADGNVTIKHGLLNPGDWLTTDILFDGQPPVASIQARISGITEPIYRTVRADSNIRVLTLVALPAPATYFALMVGSIVAVGLVAIGSGLCGSAVWGFFRHDGRWSRDHRRSGDGVQGDDVELLDHIFKHVRPTTKTGQIVHSALGVTNDIRWLDEPGALRELIAQNVSSRLLEALDQSTDSAALLLQTELRRNLHHSLTVNVHGPGDVPEAVKQFKALDLVHMSSQELASAHRKMMLTLTGGALGHMRPRLDKGDLFGGLSFVMIGVVFVILLGGTWRALLGY